MPTPSSSPRDINTEREREMAESCPMNGGDGTFSYAKNSCYQREAVDAAKRMLTDAILEKFAMEGCFPFGCFSPAVRIADFGCSVGPNTFRAVENIMEAIELKRKTATEQNPEALEFQVFFNDLSNNDFNTLFATLPTSRRYFAAGVPGSFHAQLFPKATIHLAHSSYALHWLSRVPNEVVDRNSPIWNKGRVHYTGNAEMVAVYSDQFKRDMAAFLSARAEEIVEGGLLLLLLPACEDGVLPSETCASLQFGLFGSCLIDMARMGMISEEKVDDFNLPLYYTSPKELRGVIEANGEFEMESMESFNPYVVEDLPDLHKLAKHFRAAVEGLLARHFGSQINVGELFRRYVDKMAANLGIFDFHKISKEFLIFACLKRKVPSD